MTTDAVSPDLTIALRRLKLSGLLPSALIAGTSPASIDLAEDREKWNALCDQLHIPQPPGGTATDLEQALEIVERVGFPVLVRPSYVLGGTAMEIVHSQADLARYMREAFEALEEAPARLHGPVALGRGSRKRASDRLSSGNTLYFLASSMKILCISATLFGFLAAISSACVGSSARLYSSHV